MKFTELQILEAMIDNEFEMYVKGRGYRPAVICMSQESANTLNVVTNDLVNEMRVVIVPEFHNEIVLLKNKFELLTLTLQEK